MHIVDDVNAGGDVPLTTITTLVSRGGQEGHVAAAFARAFGGAPDWTGHHAALLVQQQDGISFLISQFGNRRDLERWRQSAGRARLLKELDAHSLRELCTLDRRVARIIVPSDASGPKWKLLVASWVVSFPLLLILVQLIDRVAPGSPLLLRVALTSILMSVAITWVISPLVMRWTRSWRLGNQQMRVDVVEGRGA